MSLCGINYDNGARVVKFATSKIIIVKSTTFLHHNIHKYTWTSDLKAVTSNVIENVWGLNAEEHFCS
jgi:hypothetical protein